MLIGVSQFSQLRALPSSQFRGSPARVIRWELAVAPSTDPTNAGGLVRPSPAVWGFINGVSPVEILDEPELPNHLRVVFVPKFCVDSASLGCRSKSHRRAAFAHSIANYSNLFLIITVPLESYDLEK